MLVGGPERLRIIGLEILEEVRPRDRESRELAHTLESIARRWSGTTGCRPVDPRLRRESSEAVDATKSSSSGLLSTLGSPSLCRSLLRAGFVDSFRVVMYPVITGATGAERIYDRYPDVALEMIEHRTSTTDFRHSRISPSTANWYSPSNRPGRCR
ncbi:dihydrofolate reductase family protein [Nocardia sp. NPDC001965]